MWRGVEFWVALATLIAFVDCQGYRPYDCRRPGVPCNTVNGGQCDLSSGVCTCTNGNFRGYDCGVATSTIPATCNVICGSPNICTRGGVPVTDTCVCAAPFIETTCTQRRVSSTCRTENITVNIVPLANPFTGKVYVRGRTPAQTDCDLTHAGQGVYTGTLSLSSDVAVNPCAGLLGPAVNLPNGNVEYTYFITVQYDNLISTFTDEEHEIRCIHDPNGNIGTGITVIPIQPGVLTGDNVTQSMSVTRMEIWDTTPLRDITNQGTTVRVGDDLELRVILDTNQLYANHYVESCVAYDETPSTTNRVAKTLISSGCPMQTALTVVRPPLSKTGNTITIPIKAFKFDTSSLVWFDCSVKVCTTTADVECAPTSNDCTYGGVDTKFGRKKRQSSDGKTRDVNVQGQFLVVELDVNRGPVTNTRNVVTQESCLQSIPFVAVAVVFAILLLLTLVVAIFLCVRHSSRNRQRLVQKQAPSNGFHNLSMSKA